MTAPSEEASTFRRVIDALWDDQLRPRLVSALRRPWTVGFFLLFSALAFGFVDLGMGISRLAVDEPQLDTAAAGWISIALNSASFWTGLMLAVTSAVVSSLVVYEWNIAPRADASSGKTTYFFPDVNIAKAFGEFLQITLWIYVIFTVLLFHFNGSYADTGSASRYFAGLLIGSVVFGAFGRAAIWALAAIRKARNAQEAARGLEPGDGPTNRGWREMSAADAADRQNLAAGILFLTVAGFAVLLVAVGAVIPIATIYLVVLVIYSAFKTLAYFTLLARVSILIAAGLWIGNAGWVTHVLGIWGDDRDFAAVAHLNLDFPGFQIGSRDYYADPVDQLIDLRRPGGDSGGPSPADRLSAWAAHYSAANAGEKPVLVVISTSGGAYRAGFWTGLVLDEFLRTSEDAAAYPQFDDLAESVRLITGASGGMVGASYFATRPEGEPGWRAIGQLERDILCVQNPDQEKCQAPADYHRAIVEDRFRIYSTEIPFPRQTLPAVAQHTLQHDLPSVLWGGRTAIDRGDVLEGQWAHLREPISFLGAALYRPSMIFSPMIVETGQQLLISDLNLSGLAAVRKQEAVELAGHFPGIRETLAIRTAVRMQAAFPYITPAVSLPTKRSNRVVDAGYYDNYGVAVAVQVLRDPQVSAVVREKFAAVTVIEVRAFPDELDPPRSTDSIAFDWATSPLEAVLSARGNSMNFRNRQALRAVQDMYREADPATGAPAIPVHRLVFTNCTRDTSLNWFVPAEELAQMRDRAEKELARNLPDLQTIWQRDPDAAPIWAEGYACPEANGGRSGG